MSVNGHDILSHMSLERLLPVIQQIVDKKLRDYFQEKINETKTLDPAAVVLADQIADFTLRGGKRTRAFLVFLGYEIAKSEKRGIPNSNGIPDQSLPQRRRGVGDDKLLSAMLGIELFQSFALIHDDIIDEDSERRGGKTVHTYFKSQIIKLNDQKNDQNDKQNHFGESLAILAGDLAFAWSMELIRKAESKEVTRLFYQMAEETILGQTLDVLKVVRGEEIDKKKIDELKTAYYSVIRPLQLGALLGGGNEKLVSELKTYGLTVGLAYQLADDYLDGEIRTDKFETEKHAYLEKVEPLVSGFSSDSHAKKLLKDFARFVVSRAG